MTGQEAKDLAIKVEKNQVTDRDAELAIAIDIAVQLTRIADQLVKLTQATENQ